jgi:hypothetical protein
MIPAYESFYCQCAPSSGLSTLPVTDIFPIRDATQRSENSARTTAGPRGRRPKTAGHVEGARPPESASKHPIVKFRAHRKTCVGPVRTEEIHSGRRPPESFAPTNEWTRSDFSLMIQQLVRSRTCSTVQFGSNGTGGIRVKAPVARLSEWQSAGAAKRSAIDLIQRENHGKTRHPLRPQEARFAAERRRGCGIGEHRLRLQEARFAASLAVYRAGIHLHAARQLTRAWTINGNAGAVFQKLSV